MGGEHLAGEEVDDVGARAVEGRDERVLVLRARERERRQVDAGGPALGAGDQQVDVFGWQLQAEAAVEELARLAGGEAQLVGAQLEQLAADPQRAERECRVGAGRDHQLDARRQVVDEPRDRLARRGARQAVEVVEHERDLVALGERVDQPRQHDLAQRRAGGGRVEPERGDHVRPQHDRVVVALVERHPRDRPPLQLGLPPGGEQRRLAEAGRAGDERQAAALAVAQALEEPLARDRLGRDERRMELGDEEDAPTFNRGSPRPSACGLRDRPAARGWPGRGGRRGG